MVVALVAFVCVAVAGTGGYRIGRASARFVPPPSPQFEHTGAVTITRRPAFFDWQREEATHE